MRIALVTALLILTPATHLAAQCTTPPTATVTGTQTICPQSSIARIFAHLTGTPPFTLTWSDGLFDNGITQTTYERMVPASGTPYTVTAISDAKCASGTSSGQAMVTEYTFSTAVVSGDATICEGDSATITATFTGTPPFNVYWVDGLQQIGVTTTTLQRTVSPTATTNYLIWRVQDAHCTPPVSYTNAATITVHPKPLPTVGYTTAICSGESTTLAAFLQGAGPWDVTWSDGVQQLGVTTSPAERVVSPAVTTSYSATATNGTCSSSAGPAVITVRQPATATVSGGGTICAGGSAAVTASLAGSGPWNITWSDGLTQNGVTQPTVTRMVSPSANTSYTITSVSGAGNCGGSASGAAAVTIAPPPTASLSGSATACTGHPATISAALTGTAPWTVTWSDGFVQTNVTQSPATRQVSPGLNTLYAVTAVSDAFCSGGSGGGQMSVVIAASPSAAVSAPASTCPSSTANTAAVANAGAGADYVWTVANGTLLSGNHTPSIAFSAGESGAASISVTVSNAAGCTATGSATVPIVADACATACLPPSIANAPALTHVLFGQRATLRPTIGGSEPLTIQWYEGEALDTSHPIAGTRTLETPAITSTRTFWVRITNGCGSTDSATMTVDVANVKRRAAKP